ncbi:MAG: cobalamin biosynthesis protein [Chlorobiaceae bacterium]|nr:cobalamin biosynthesis protein [Chlorobiaceae bacterium]NTV61794.1 cobalamin biosynthesis protein [Chlorobiaceae bacterium]
MNDMSQAEYLLVAALLLDLLFGDPRWMPHPVKGIGWFAFAVEKYLRRSSLTPVIAGVFCVASVVGVSAGTAWLVSAAAAKLHPLAGMAVSVLLLYTTLAVKDLGDHALAVKRALEKGDAGLARRRVSMMVGRDTENLDQGGIALAAVESVAENTVDGVTAPLFYAILFGPAGAVAYKAVNTLDSLFGHLDDRYREFGRASAKLDDLANWLPARLTVFAIALASIVRKSRFFDIFKAVQRGAKLHASPNAGYPEAAFAGALGVALGGKRSYGGVLHETHTLGIRRDSCRPETIQRSVDLMRSTTVVFLAAGILMKFLVMQLL